MFTLTKAIIIFALGCLFGIIFMSITDLLTLKHGKWKYGRVWYAVNERGEVIRAQFLHPKREVQETIAIIQEAQRGEKL